MTRREILQKAAESFCNERTNPQLLVGDYSFIKGAEWADANPKNPWISVKDDLPCYHEEMVKVAVEDADTYTDRVLAMTDEGILTIAYMYKPTPYSWHWSETERITHWMPITKLPEE